MANGVAEQLSAAPGKVKNIALLVLQIACAAMFLMAGALKLAGAEKMVETFATLGFGQWFRYFTGIVEVLGAVALVIPAIAGLSALSLAVVMVCAVIAHVAVLGGSPAPAIVLLVLVGIVAWGRKERAARWFAR
jgi:putative oxidoreductase